MGYRPGARNPRAGRSNRLALILTIAGLILFLLVLDYLGWVTGHRSHVFALVLGRHAAPDLTEFYRLTTRELASNGVKKKAVSGFLDRAGVFHVKVELLLPQYERLAGPLENTLVTAGARVQNIEASRENDTTFYLWTIQGRGKDRMALLFVCAPRPKEKAAAEAPAATAPAPRPAAGRNGLVALILDDMGNSLEAAQQACELGLPVTIAVLPFSAHAVETAQVAHECGLEVILHLPMESLADNSTEKDTPGLITTSMSDAEIRKTAEDCLEDVPYIRGVNNHMGSKLTEMERPMTQVLETLKGKNLYFVDSRTSGRSVAYDLARSMGIPAGASNLFLDPGDDNGTPGEPEVRSRIVELVALARKTGRAIGICHPRPATFSALAACRALNANDGVTFVFASRLVHD